MAQNTPQPRSPIDDWSSRTPLLTRWTLMLIVSLYILSVLFSQNELAFATVPYNVLYNFEIYRLLISPFFHGSLLSILFVCLSFASIGGNLEKQEGTFKFGCLMLSIGLITNALFVIVCLVIAINPIVPSPITMINHASGFWSIFLGLNAYDCFQNPEAPRRFLFFPTQIKSKYYPLALLVFFSLLSGFRLELVISMFVGILFRKGFFSKIDPTREKLMHWEETGSFVWMTHQPGFVSCSGTLPTGVEAVAPGSSTTRTSWVSSSSGGVVSTGRSSTAPSAPTKDQKFVGQGHTLGS